MTCARCSQAAAKDSRYCRRCWRFLIRQEWFFWHASTGARWDRAA